MKEACALGKGDGPCGSRGGGGGGGGGGGASMKEFVTCIVGALAMSNDNLEASGGCWGATGGCWGTAGAC